MTADLPGEARTMFRAKKKYLVKVRPGDKRMSPDTIRTTGKRWKASELRKLPPEQRDANMEAATILAEADYRNDPELTAFEAFGKDDLHGDSASTQTR